MQRSRYLKKSKKKSHPVVGWLMRYNLNAAFKAAIAVIPHTDYQ